MKKEDKKIKMGIKKKQLLICFIILSSLLILNSISRTYAQDISTEGITTITEDLDPDFIFYAIKKIYEISPSSLEKGYSTTLNEKDAFKLDRIARSYYIIVWNITEEEAIVIFPGKRKFTFSPNDVILVDMNQDGILDIQLELKSIEQYETSKTVVSIEINDEEEFIIKNVEKVKNRKANFYIKKFVEKELIPDGDYFELFDVTVRLAEKTIYSAGELGAFITFENFGEGPSEIDIVYSIINKNGEEIYRGVDSKVVQTEDLVVKDFNFLELPLGKYILKTEIFYGKNQTGESEQDFEIIKRSIMNLLELPLIFIGSIIFLFIIVLYLKKYYKSNSIVEDKFNGQRDLVKRK